MTKTNDSGSAIITVIVFLTITLFFISLIILYDHQKNKLIKNYGAEVQSFYTAKSAVLLSLTKYEKQLKKNNYNPKTYKYSLFNKDTTWITMRPWGVFIYCSAKSKIKNISKERQFLISLKPDHRFNAAVIIGDLKNPLVVSGQTVITGDVIVGPAGIKAGTMHGSHYKGKKLVFGSIRKESESFYPQLNEEPLLDQMRILRQNEELAASLRERGKQTINLENRSVYLDQTELDNLIQEGLKEITGPGIIYLKGAARLQNISLRGLITIYSEDEVAFYHPVKAENILVIAGRIKIGKNLVLRGQFIATDGIKIGNEVKLEYPSVVYLISREMVSDEANLTIDDNVTINGGVILAGTSLRSNLSISEKGVVNGFTYSGNYTQLAGTVNGTVMTKSFYLYSSPTLYINWINNAVIDRKYLLSEYFIPLCFNIPPKLKIMQEL